MIINVCLRGLCVIGHSYLSGLRLKNRQSKAFAFNCLRGLHPHDLSQPLESAAQSGLVVPESKNLKSIILTRLSLMPIGDMFIMEALKGASF